MSHPTTETPSSPIETLIVGGSLGGLTTALAVAAKGRSATILERTSRRTQRGVAILASGASLRRALGDKALQHVENVLGPDSLTQRTYPQAWWDVYSGLRTAADAEPLITVIEHARIDGIGQDDEAVWAASDDGRTWLAEVLLGADGYRSIVRRHVDVARPTADYAGYVVWLGQSDLPPALIDRAGEPDFVMNGDDMLATYPLMDRQQRLRRYGWGWFDPNHNALFRQIGAIEGNEVKYTPGAADIPDEIYDAMIRKAAQWEEPWRTGLIAAFQNRDVIVTPITEYLPQRVVNGRVALIGDAAHAQTPMTGSGFEEAVADAAALANSLVVNETVTLALQHYEQTRLTDMQRLVASGQSFSRSFAGTIK